MNLLLRSVKTLPIVRSLNDYKAQYFYHDVIAGCVTTFVAIPQSMAYAQLAGFPAEYGLYSALLPLILYAFMGSSRTLIVGPAALICLLVADTLSQFDITSKQQYLTVSVNLSLLSGIWLLILGLCKLGRLAQFISTPVMTGFTTASALIILFSQVETLFGLSPLSFSSLFEGDVNVTQLWQSSNIVASALGLGSILCLFVIQRYLVKWLTFIKLPQQALSVCSKLGPLLVVCVSISIVAYFDFVHMFDLEVVGYIPQSLPTFDFAMFEPELWLELTVPALSIALICFITSLSTASILVAKHHQRVKPNQELLALGLANVGAAITGTFAIAGSVSRSMINFSVGAKTQVANIFSVGLTIVIILSLVTTLYYLPTAVLSAIVIYSVLPMINLGQVFRHWDFDFADSLSRLITFIAVLVLGVETGIWVGIACSIILLIQRSSSPHIAEVGKTENGHFKNVLRTQVKTLPSAMFLRVDESLYFANVQQVEDYVLKQSLKSKELRHVVLIFSSVNFVDESALESLIQLEYKLARKGVILYFSDVKGFLLDKLRKTDLAPITEKNRLFYTANDAMNYIERLAPTVK